MTTQASNKNLKCPNCGLEGTMKDFTYSEEVKQQHDAPNMRLVDDKWVIFCKCGWISTPNKWSKQTDNEYKVHIGLPL